MPSPKSFTDSELDLARAMRADKASWRAIGRELGCNDDTIRCALDPDYLRKRHDQIVARKRERNKAAKAAREAKQARSAALYQPSRADSAPQPRRITHVGRLTSLRGFA